MAAELAPVIAGMWGGGPTGVGATGVGTTTPSTGNPNGRISAEQMFAEVGLVIE
ncbi:MAG: hypothetical protein H6658_02070 [Ardenticatenaceae bacterium]|nr:hypothetical protein [Ardenticatenaceae bacterium]